MSGLFRNQKVLGCSSCNGMGETTQEDLTRWQNGDFSWGDWFWCKSNWQSVVGAIAIATPLGIPLLAYGSWVDGGRLRMHPKVPFVSPDIARVWPCVKEEDQKKINDKAAALESSVIVPAPVTPDSPSIIENLTPTTASSRTQLLTFAAVASIAAFVFMRSRGERKQQPSSRYTRPSAKFTPRKRRRRTNR